MPHPTWRFLAFMFLWKFCLKISAQNAPVLTLPEPVLTVSETQRTRQELTSSDIKCKDKDGDDTRVYLKTVSPSSPCGRCFAVWSCDKGNGFCIYYMPSQGTLNYAARPSYLLTIGCTDDNDPETVGFVEVRVIANTPPVFTAPKTGHEEVIVKATKSKRAGELVYDVETTDDDGDPVFYRMSTDPITDLFDIGYANGQIRFNKDGRLLCQSSVNFYVTAYDERHPNGVGPVVVGADFTGTNSRPSVADTNAYIKIPETTAVRDVVHTLGVKDNDGISGDLYYSVKASPERGLELYTFDARKNEIKVRDTLDYEYADLRVVTLTINVTDGFCAAPVQAVTIEITDINEIPEIQPSYREITVYEGYISVDPGWKLVDPDESETHTWTRKGGGGGRFEVDGHSSFIHSQAEVDIDPNKVSQTFNVRVEVEDKDREKANAEVRLIVQDKNDNVPVFQTQIYELGASPCTAVGVVIEILTATDDDSKFQGNNQLFYSGFSNNMSVLADGSVILTNPCTPVGATDFLLAHVTDQGQYPGPLSGLPAAVSLTCAPCPSPIPNTTTSTPATDEISSDARKIGFLEHNLDWLILASLLTATLVGLLVYFLWRYCVRACYERRNRHPGNSGKTKTVSPTPVREPASRDRLPKSPTPPEPPPPQPEPFLFGFWKETFPDRDQRHAPKRDTKPASVEADKKVEEKERQEEEEEQRKRQAERQKEMDKYKKRLEAYSRQKKAGPVNSAELKMHSASAKRRCIIL